MNGSRGLERAEDFDFRDGGGGVGGSQYLSNMPEDQN